MNTRFPELSDWFLKSVVIEDDGVLGVPVTLTSYTATDAAVMTPVIEYIVGTRRERIGLEDDVSILSDLVKDYIVVVVDYHDAPVATGLALDNSIQTVRRRIMDLSLTFEGRNVLREGDNWVLPAGCRIYRHLPYFSLKKHAPIGTLDYIVKIWNEDFTEVRGNTPITFPDGTVKLVRDIHPKTAEECLRPDGRPIELNLYLDLIYPSKPKAGTRCPVAIDAASRQSTTGNWIMPSSPGYLTEFLYRGYAVMLFEHAYIPMARRDHYGYFPDGPSYKNEACDRHHGLGFQAGILSSCAAVRLLRLMIRTLPTLAALDPDAFGMICISKTGYNYALGVDHPERLSEMRFLSPNHGECAEGTVQPFLTYPDGTEIPSNVQAVYSVSGAGSYYARESMCPVMTTVGDKEGYLSFYRSVLRNAAQYNTEAFYYVIPELGHSHALGYDPRFRLDMYGAVIDFMDTHLMKSHGECAYITPRDGETIGEDAPIVLHFTGKVAKEEIEKKVSIVDVYGRAIPFKVETAYNGCTHILHATYPLARAIFVRVPAGIELANGAKTTVALENCYQVEIRHPLGAAASVNGTQIDDEHSVTISFPKTPWRGVGTPLRLRLGTVGESSQLIGIYKDGECLGKIGVGPAGFYDFDLTNVDTKSAPLTLTLRAERKCGTTRHLCVDFEKENEGYALALHDATEAVLEKIGDKCALKIQRDLYCYDKTAGYSFAVALKEGPWEPTDFGRRFIIRSSFMSPDAYAPHAAGFAVNYNREASSRYVDEFDTHHKLVHTDEAPGKWIDAQIDYAIYNRDYLTEDIDKRNIVVSHDLGTLYVGPITVDEVVSAVTIGDGTNGTLAPRLIQEGYRHG